MIDREKLDSLCKELDKFIQDNIYIEEPDYKMRDDEKPIEKNNEILNKFISEYKTVNREPFHVVLNKMINEIKLENEQPNIYKLALISKDHFSKLINNKNQPKKNAIISLGFALNSKNIQKNNMLNKNPKLIMNELLISRRDEYFIIGYNDPFDLAIIFCLEKLADTECDITDIDYQLKSQGLPLLSEMLLKEFSIEQKLEMIESMIKIISFNKYEQLRKELSLIEDENEREYKKENKEEELGKKVSIIESEYKEYFECKEKNYNVNNNVNEMDEYTLTSVSANAIYLPLFEYIEN
jgi:hypothetical protein